MSCWRCYRDWTWFLPHYTRPVRLVVRRNARRKLARSGVWVRSTAAARAALGPA